MDKDKIISVCEKYIKKEEGIKTVEGLAVALKMTREALLTLEYDKEMGPAISRAKTLICEDIIKGALRGAYNVRMATYILTNDFNFAANTLDDWQSASKKIRKFEEIIASDKNE